LFYCFLALQIPLFMCESVLLPTCNLFSCNANANWLPGYNSPNGYSRQPVLLLHLIFHFVVIFSHKCKSTLKVVVVVVVVVVVARHHSIYIESEKSGEQMQDCSL